MRPWRGTAEGGSATSGCWKAERRDTADGKTGVLVHKVGISLQEFFTNHSSDQAGVYTVSAAGDDEDGLTGLLALEYQRFGDLGQRSADGISCLLSSAGALAELQDGKVISKRSESIFYDLYAGFLFSQ